MLSLRGNLLIAGPSLVDPNFHRAVVLVGQHDEAGAVGVVLNRESEVETGVQVALRSVSLLDPLFLVVGILHGWQRRTSAAGYHALARFIPHRLTASHPAPGGDR